MYNWARFEPAIPNRVLYKTLLFLFIIPLCRPVLVNRTIDSNKGDQVTGFMPIYQPQSPWDDQTCSQCFIQPDIAKAYDGTWNAATYNPQLQTSVNITLQFTGVAIWVFFILANANIHGPGTTTNTQVNITLNGQYAGSFSHDPDMNTLNLIYNATIFSKTGLVNASHQLVIATNDYPINTFLNFDWAIYTADVDVPASQSASLTTMAAFSSTTDLATNPPSTSTTPSPTSTPQNSASKTGVIVGCTLGALVLIALILVFFIRRSRQPPPVRHEKVEGALNIDAPSPQPPHGRGQMHRHGPSTPSPLEYTHFPPPSPSSATNSPVRNYAPERSKRAILREARQMEIDRRIQSAQREMANLKSVQDARSAGEIGSPSAPGQPLRPQELDSLRNELQQLRDQIGNLQTQREPGLSNDPLPPAYTQHSTL